MRQAETPSVNGGCEHKSLASDEDRITILHLWFTRYMTISNGQNNINKFCNIFHDIRHTSSMDIKCMTSFRL